MNPAKLLEHFDRISEAPDAVARLRRFILDLAVRGKLVEQDPNDEPAAELLTRIRSEKARCEKKSKELAPVTVDEAPFDVPAGWEWVRIRQITTDRGQTVPKGDFTYIDVTAIDKERGRIGEPTILSSTDAPSRARKVVKKGDVIYSCVRPNLLNIAIVETEILPPPIASTAFAVMNGFGLTLPQYLWTALRSPFMVDSVEERMRGQAYPAINDSDFSLLPIPLPPFAEQHRIVAKVDELMVLCDQLEAAKNEREARRDRLVAASLNRIGTAPAAADEAATAAQNATPLRDAARFHLDHLPRLTTRPEHIKQLRQAILNLAVRGRLVSQDPNDEPAAGLLKRIGVTGIKMEAPSLAVSDKLIAQLPVSWECVELGRIATVGTGTTPSRGIAEFFTPPDIPWVTSGETSAPYITNTEQHVSERALKETSLKLYPKGTLLVAMYGQGKTRGQITELCIEATTNQACAAIVLKLEDHFHRRFIKLYFQKIYDEIRELAAGGAQPNLNVSKVKSTLIHLPPLAEQHRIVAKVDELMALCDQLEAQLTATQTDSRRLLEAVLHEALAAAA